LILESLWGGGTGKDPRNDESMSIRGLVFSFRVSRGFQKSIGRTFEEPDENGFGVRAIPVVSRGHLTPRFPRIPDVDRSGDGPENNQKGNRHREFLPHGGPSKEQKGHPGMY
jgi:hypothetical protein